MTRTFRSVSCVSDKPKPKKRNREVRRKYQLGKIIKNYYARSELIPDPDSQRYPLYELTSDDNEPWRFRVCDE